MGFPGPRGEPGFTCPAVWVLGPPKALQEMEKLFHRVSSAEVKVTIARLFLMEQLSVGKSQIPVLFCFFFPLELLREQCNLLLSTWIPQTGTAGREEGSSLLWQCSGQVPLILHVKATP